ncbi:MAG TPA: hypothetical protein VE891_16085 [Allosphingosinicella sp.]|nr:hypothetical protein [Allosphingosinicella sp.]
MTGGENVGALAERQRRRRYWTLMGLALAAAVVIGLAGRILGTPYGPIAPAAAIGLAAALLVLTVVGNWVYFRSIDELEVASNLIGGFWGFYAFMVGWPLWHILWRGGLAPQPEFLPLYMGAGVVALAGFLWKRLL